MDTTRRYRFLLADDLIGTDPAFASYLHYFLTTLITICVRPLQHILTLKEPERDRQCNETSFPQARVIDVKSKA